jgi:hypothetical protein
MNGEFVWMWEEAVMSYIKVPYHFLIDGNDVNMIYLSQNSQFSI